MLAAPRLTEHPAGGGTAPLLAALPLLASLGQLQRPLGRQLALHQRGPQVGALPLQPDQATHKPAVQHITLQPTLQ